MISRAAHQVPVRLGELEDRYDLQDVGDVDSVRPPRALGIPGRPRRVDHRRAQSFSDRREAFRRVTHQVAVGEPAIGHRVIHRDEGHVPVYVGHRLGHRLDMVGSRNRDFRARIVEHVSDLRAAQPVVDGHDDQSGSPRTADDLCALDRVERHQRDAVLYVAAKAFENRGRAASPLAQVREIHDAVSADERRLVRQRIGVGGQEIEAHSSDPKSARGLPATTAPLTAWPSKACCPQARMWRPPAQRCR